MPPRGRPLAVALLAALAAGCGGKPAPVYAPPVPAPAPGERVPTAADKPAASDPQAVALVHAALDAHTGNDRSAVRKFRTVEYKRQGVGQGLENNPLGLTWAVSSAWPDRMRVVAEFPGPIGPSTVTLAWDGPAAWRRLTPPNQPPGPVFALTAEELANLRIDNTGQWLWLLFPLDESGSVFAPAPPVELAGVTCPGVYLFHPSLAPAAVHFDPTTKLLARIAYEGREGNRPGTQVFQPVETKPYHGVKLAHRLAQTFEGKQSADWTLASIEPKAKLDDALFAPPK